MNENNHLSEEFRLLDRYESQNDLIAALKALPTFRNEELSKKVSACHRDFVRKRCDQGHEWVDPVPTTCGCRLCPHDQRKRSVALGARLSAFLADRNHRYRYLVLSEQNSTDLREGLKSLLASWTRFRRSQFWSERVRGAALAVEVTYNSKPDSPSYKTWHPHINVLFEGEFLPFEELNAAWVAATRDHGRSSYIKAVKGWSQGGEFTTIEAPIRELIKYVTKLADIVAFPDAVDEFITATYNLRFFRTYGTFYRMPAEAEEEISEGPCCPDCGSTVISRCGSPLPWSLWPDVKKGVFRERFATPTVSLIEGMPWLGSRGRNGAVFDRGG